MEERGRLVADAQRCLDDFNKVFALLIQRGQDLRRLSDRAPSSSHEAMILRASQQNARAALARLGLIPPSEPLPRQELRVSLCAMLEHIDAGALAWARRVTAGDDDSGAAA